MGEFSDAWSAVGRKNIFGTVPDVIEMQSEAGAAGAVHGSLAGGCVDDDLYGVARPVVDDPEHVQDCGRVVADGLSHFGTYGCHARVVDFWRPQRRDGLPQHGLGDAGFQLACRRFTTWRWWRMRPRSKSRVPFLHFFDGFRSSHEVNKIEVLNRRRHSGDDRRAVHRGVPRSGDESRTNR